jgi:LPS export ABC transporter protein LptC
MPSHNKSLKVRWKLLLWLSGGLFLSCENNLHEINEYNALADSLSIETAEGVKIIYTDSSKRKATIYAKILERHPDIENPYTEMKDGLRAYFYDQEEKVNSTLNADYGISYEESEIITVKRNVKVRNIRDEELETEELHWDQKNKKIYTDQFVKIRRKDEILYGTGFESNETFTRYKIKKPEGKFTIQENKELPTE